MTPRFQRRGYLGSGGLGVVYKVYDEEMGQEVALKTLPALDPDKIYYIKEEFRALVGIAHPNLVELYELFVDGDSCFFTMELVEGVPLTNYVWQGQLPRTATGLPPLAIARLKASLQQLTRAIAALHREGKVHRDIKPSNVLVTRAGRVVLLDFDMVTRFQTKDVRHQSSRRLVGTIAYMSPEQSWGMPLTPATDWYSTGILIFEALSGRLPFQGNFQEILMNKRHGAPSSLRKFCPDTPEDLDALVRALLHPDPAHRADERDIMDIASDPGPVSAPVVSNWTRSAVAGIPFVGRFNEMTTLQNIFENTLQGVPAVVHIEGHSGMGKTELIRRFLRWVDSGARALILQGACYPQESVPYKALDSLVDELSRYLNSLPRAVRSELVPGHVAALTRMFPVLGRVSAFSTATDVDPDMEPQQLRLHGFRALRELLTKLAQRQPIVLWIDDLQWGDADSAPLFREILRPPDTPPLMLLLSYRGDEVQRSQLLMSLTGSMDIPEAWIHNLSVGPLAADEVQKLIGQLLDSKKPNGHLTEIAVEYAGSPLFLTMFAHYLADTTSSGELDLHDDAILGNIIKQRFERLSDSARRVLDIAAIAGQPIDRSLLLRAAELEQTGRLDVSRLSQAHLLKPTQLDNRPAVQIYHDRIRDAVLADLTPERIRWCHLRIARVLGEQRDADPETLVEHYLGAGETAAAAALALDAAVRAEAVLAFDRAAELYQIALESGQLAMERWRVHERRAVALANAGRGGESGKSFEAAAQALQGPQWKTARIEMRRRAAEQYLRAGHFEHGTAALREVLAAHHIDYPATHRHAVASLLVHRAILWSRGLHFEERNAQQISAEQLARMDACWSAGLGLAWIDRIRTAAFQARYFLLSLEAGEPARIARALAAEASELACFGVVNKQQRSQKMMERARQLASASGDPSVVAFTTLMEATIALYNARWRQVHELCSRAQAILRERCRGVAWEMTTAHILDLAALAYLGEIKQLRQELFGLLDEARDRGDLLALATLASGVPNVAWLASDEPDKARGQLDSGVAIWKQQEPALQRYLDLIARVPIDLYRGDSWAGYERITAAWPGLWTSLNMSIQQFRVTLHHLRARAALAVAATKSIPARGLRGIVWRAQRERLLRSAEKDADQLATETTPWAWPLSAAVRAGVAAVRGNTERALWQLDRAATGFRAVDMQLYAAAAQYWRGILLGGEIGRRLWDEGEQWMAGQGIVRPERLAAVLVPGLDQGIGNGE